MIDGVSSVHETKRPSKERRGGGEGGRRGDLNA